MRLSRKCIGIETDNYQGPNTLQYMYITFVLSELACIRDFPITTAQMNQGVMFENRKNENPKSENRENYYLFLL